MIKGFRGKTPVIPESCFIAENATIIGDVTLGENCSVWFGAVIRADEDSIVIGDGSNVQDNVILHCDEGIPVNIGKNVSIGHGAMIHGATIADNVLIGMGAIVMNGAYIEENSVIGAGCVCKENMVVESGSVVVGVPGKAVKNAMDYNASMNSLNAMGYIKLNEEYLKEMKE